MTNLNQINSSTELQNHLTAQELWQERLAVRAQAPLVHSITNWVVIILMPMRSLAMGASPVMAHACEEVADMAEYRTGIGFEIGTLTAESPSHAAGTKASAQSAIPVVLDPVGAGATLIEFRR